MCYKYWMPFESKFIKEKLTNMYIKVPNPNWCRWYRTERLCKFFWTNQSNNEATTLKNWKSETSVFLLKWLKGNCYHPFLEEFWKLGGYGFGLFLNDFLQKSFSLIHSFPKFSAPSFSPKQVKSGLGVKKMLYLSIKSKVSFIHLYYFLTTLFH